MSKQRFFRKIIKITAWDSPNVRLALAQQEAGLEPTGEVIIPGVLPWHDFQKRLATWDKIRQKIGLEAEFWEGAEFLMYPPEWLNRAERIYGERRGVPRQAKAIGIDTGEGSAKTVMTAGDELGVIEWDSQLTSDTSVVVPNLIAFASRLGVTPQNWVFDRGGGGKVHADRLRQMGYPVRTVAFGSAVTKDDWKRRTKEADRIDQREQQYVYFNRRAQMYWETRLLLDPANARGFGIPEQWQELRHQLSLIPLMYDPEGRIKMLPKSKRSKDSTEMTLEDLIGHSPDEADSLVLMVHGILHRPETVNLGAIW